MARIVDAVDQWWSVPYLSWFTDHGPRHSERVAEAALLILDNPDVPPRHQPTPVELYVAWAAAWLHDVGMQALGDDKLGELNVAAYSRVRKAHALRSRDTIRDQPESFGLPTDALLVEAIALVAGAHGTSHYREHVAKLEQFESLRNTAFRGPLLAATVLLADEMDLDATRVPALPARPVLSETSAAHARKHEFVVASAISHSRGEVRLSVTLQRAEGVPPEEQHAVQLWITEKLRQQIALVEADYTEGLSLYSRLSRDIEVKYQHGSRLTPLNEHTRAVIEADLAQFELINHQRCLDTIASLLDAGQPVVITGRMQGAIAAQTDESREFGYVDIDGREDILRAVLARRRIDGAQVLTSRSLYETSGAASLRDVLDELYLPFQEGASREDLAQEDEILGLLLDALAAAKESVVGISSFDQLRDADQEWILDILMPRLQGRCGTTFVLTSEGPPQYAPPRKMNCVPSHGLDRAGVANYLARYVPPPTPDSEAAAGFRYAKYKELKQHHLASAALQRESR